MYVHACYEQIVALSYQQSTFSEYLLWIGMYIVCLQKWYLSINSPFTMNLRKLPSPTTLPMSTACSVCCTLPTNPSPSPWSSSTKSSSTMEPHRGSPVTLAAPMNSGCGHTHQCFCGLNQVCWTSILCMHWIVFVTGHPQRWLSLYHCHAKMCPTTSSMKWQWLWVMEIQCWGTYPHDD